MMHVLYAMEENALRSYINLKDEVYAAQKTMSADAIREAKKEIFESSSLNIYNPETDDPKDLYSIDKDGNARIPITGMLTPKADACMVLFGESVTEYSFIQAASIAADNDSRVKEIIFDFNTNGGRVDGVDQTSQVIANLKKHTTGMNHGAALSAGLYLISQCDKIIDSTPAAFHGSLGVVVEFIDRSKEMNDRGIQRVILTSTDAPDKRADITKDEGKKLVIQELDDVHNIFAGRVIDGRSKALGKQLSREYVNEHFGAGGILISEKAIKVGLSDGVLNPLKNPNELIYNKKDKKKSTHKDEIPAEAGENKRRFTNMSLKQLLEENPTAKAEYEEDIRKAKAEGKTEAHTVFAKVEPYFTGEKTYPKNIMAHAFKALSGEQGADVFIGAVAAYDAAKEAMASQDAQTETDENPDIPSEPPKGPEGAAKTPEEIKALAEADGAGA